MHNLFDFEVSNWATNELTDVHWTDETKKLFLPFILGENHDIPHPLYVYLWEMVSGNGYIGTCFISLPFSFCSNNNFRVTHCFVGTWNSFFAQSLGGLCYLCIKEIINWTPLSRAIKYKWKKHCPRHHIQYSRKPSRATHNRSPNPIPRDP